MKIYNKLVRDKIIEIIEADGRVAKYRILDNNEYNFHKKIMNYPSEIDVIVKKELNKLIEMKKNNDGPFNKNLIEQYHHKYEELKKYGII